MSAAWERLGRTRQCAICAREFEHSGAGRPPSRCPRCREQEPPRKHRAAVALVATPPVALPVTPSLPPGPQRIDYGAVIRHLEMRAGLIADAVQALRALEENHDA